MEADERPTKKRRLSSDEQPRASDACPQYARSNGHHLENSIENSGIDSSPGIDSPEVLPAPVDFAPLSTALETPIDSQPLSKNQQKKLRKKQEWESKRPERRIIRKQKAQEKKQRRREKFKLDAQNSNLPKQVTEKPFSQKAVQLPITFLIDCDFDELMLDNERISLAGQITRCYSDNRKAPLRAHLGICSFTGKLRKRFDEVLTHHKGWKDVRFLECDFVEAAENAKQWMAVSNCDRLAGAFSTFAADSGGVKSRLQEAGEIVYLTSESNNTLTELKPYSTYIIGGLVDKNREKGICYKRATKRGVRTAKLPIGEFMDMQGRKVLATNHVNEVMLRWLECGNWGEAFLRVIPKRKEAKLKGREEEEEEDDGYGEGSQVAKGSSDLDALGADEAEEEPEGDIVQSFSDGIA